MDLDKDPDNFLNAEEIENAAHVGDNPNEIRFSKEDAGALTDQGSTSPRRHRHRRFIVWSIVIVAIAGAIALYLRYFNPYIVDAQATGYISGVECRGYIFKTFEGELIPTAPMHIDGVYSRDFKFSVTDDSLAHRLQHYQAAHTPVTIVYEQYPATLPWRGASTVIVTAVKPAPTTPAQ